MFLLAAEAYLEHYQISQDRVFCENSSQLKAVNYFCKKASSQLFDMVLNGPYGSKWTIDIFEHTIKVSITPVTLPVEFNP